MAKTIATIGGIALAPGVSRNRRLYTPDHVKNAVTRAQKRIDAGERPMVMLTHHGAGDDSTRIAASLTSVSLDEAGRARYTADIADTGAGRNIASLTDTSDGQPAHLDGVSIRGAWLGTVRKVRGPDGQPVETADDLELDGLDFTHSPGVDDAGIDTFSWAARSGRSETTERVLITESVQEARVTAITEETSRPEPSLLREALQGVLPGAWHVLDNGECLTCADIGEARQPMSKRGSGISGPGGPYADPGFQADKKQRYQLDTKAHAKAAWSFIGQADNAKAYTAAQLKRIKGRIIKALKSFGVSVATETAGLMFDAPFQVSEAVAEFYGDGSCAGSWCVRATNGPVTIDLSSYGMDPGDLDKVLRAAADAACKALAALDPDMDGDIDVPGVGPATDPDGDAPAETTSGDPATEAATDPASDPAAETREETEVPAMADTATQETAGQAPAAGADPKVIAEAVAAVLDARDKAKAAKKASKAVKAAKRAAAESANPGAGVTETADDRIARLVEERAAARIAAEVTPVVTETEDQRIERLVEARVTAEKQRLVASGAAPAGRKGLTDPVNEHTAPLPGGATGELNSHGWPAAWPDKPAHEFNSEEQDRYFGPALTGHVLGDRASLLA